MGDVLRYGKRSQTNTVTLLLRYNEVRETNWLLHVFVRSENASSVFGSSKPTKDEAVLLEPFMLPFPKDEAVQAARGEKDVELKFVLPFAKDEVVKAAKHEMDAESKAPKKAELEAKKKAELEAKKLADLEAKKKAELEATKQAEVEAKKKAELEAKKLADLEAKKQADLEAKKKAELETKKQCDLDTKNDELASAESKLITIEPESEEFWAVVEKFKANLNGQIEYYVSNRKNLPAS